MQTDDGEDMRSYRLSAGRRGAIVARRLRDGGGRDGDDDDDDDNDDERRVRAR